MNNGESTGSTITRWVRVLKALMAMMQMMPVMKSVVWFHRWAKIQFKCILKKGIYICTLYSSRNKKRGAKVLKTFQMKAFHEQT
jgi:hypothetical protein